MVAPDEKTFEYLQGRDFVPKDEAFEEAVRDWKDLPSDEGAIYDETVRLTAEDVYPQVTWGTNPGMVTDINGKVPDPASINNPAERESIERALEYMALKPNTEVKEIPIDRVFIGSCTNSRISDLREAARVAEGRKVTSDVRALVVPGSHEVRDQARSEGLDEIFKAAGFDWREPGCSMCLAMNPDKLQGRELCASSSNRNFKGRQGSPTGRTLLMSPAMVAAAAVTGEVTDVRSILN